MGESKRRKANASKLVAEITTLADQPDFARQQLVHTEKEPSPQEINMLVDMFNEKRYAEMETLARKVTVNFPNHGIGWKALGTALVQQGFNEEALVSLQKAVELSQEDFQPYNNLGNALVKLDRLSEAEAAYRRALELNSSFIEAYYNLGNTLQKLGGLHESEALYRRALELKPDFVEVHNGLGNILSGLNRQSEAEASYRRALQIRPGYAEANSNLGNILQVMGRPDEAEVYYRQVLEINPDYAFTFGRYLHSKMHCCNWEGIDDTFRELLGGIDADKAVSTPFTLLAIPSTPAQQKRCAEIYIREKHTKVSAYSNINIRYSHDKIRLAYVSADFREHAVGQLIAGVFEQHDKSRFEIIAISLCLDDQSRLRARMLKAFDKFVDANQMEAVQIAQMMRDMEIDIAVDLGGHTSNSRTDIFALRPAPLQVNYLGYTGTMGADYMDYILADRHVIPESDRAFYSEKVAYLPDTFQANDAHKTMSERQFTRSEAGLPDEGFVFCCFNNNFKITPIVFDIWMQILKQAEGSVLWLLESNVQAAHNLQNEAMKRGIAPERLVFAKRMDLPDHLARHRLADLFLDTFFYNAATTASDALRVGLPVLTYLGDTFVGRVAASLLNAIGLPELITYSHEEYKTLAIELATNPGKLARIKQKLARNRTTHPLFDTKLFTRHIEDAYTRMWKRHQESLLPDHIYVRTIK